MGVPFRFTPEWRITLFALILVPALAGLGVWQLQRAAQKSALQADFEAQRARPPAAPGDLAAAPEAELAYRPVRLTGRYRPGQYFLLDNRLRHGRYGNEVIAVFELDPPPGLALVNRGWLPADPARTSLPEPPAVTGSVTLRGHVYIPPGQPYLLAEEPLPAGWPKRIQAVRVPLLRPALGPEAADVFPHLIRIEPGEPGALSTGWQVVNLGPAKHVGYAVQWFLMSAVLAFLYLWRNSNLRQWLATRRGSGTEVR